MDIFISYRRKDSEGHAGRLYDSLKRDKSFKPFMDVDDIKTGQDFEHVIDERLASCDAVLVVIGRGWINAQDDAGRRRLDLEGDHLRLEIEAALKRGLPLIPVTVWEAKMPPGSALPDSIKGFSKRNATALSHQRWDTDIEALKTDIKDEIKRTRGRGLSKLGSKNPPMAGREIVARWLEDRRPPTLVGRNGGLKGKLLRADIESGGWKNRRYDIAYEDVDPPTNWFRVTDFVEALIPNATHEGAGRRSETGIAL